MPLPEPSQEESRNEFIERCMADDTMRDEYPEIDQRYAVCIRQWSGGTE